MRQWLTILLIAALVLTANFSSAQNRYDDVLFQEDFESGWGWWYPTNASWAIGPPTAGPSSAVAGEACAGTNLDGNYASGADSRLVSPPIDLTGVSMGTPLTLEIRSWHGLAADDFAFIEYSQDGFNWSAIGDTLIAQGQTWSRQVLDLSELGGMNVYLAFHILDDTGSGQSFGWYLDEIRILTGQCSDSPITLPETWVEGWGCWSADNGLWSVGVPSSGPSQAASDTVCAGTNLAGAYPATANSRLVSPPLELPDVVDTQERLLCEFNYWQSMNTADVCQVEVRTSDGQWHLAAGQITGAGSDWSHFAADVTAFAGQNVSLGIHFIDNGSSSGNSHGIFVDDLELRVVSTSTWSSAFDFDDGWAGWYADNGVWQVGIPTSGPYTPYNGPSCAGTNLDGNYPLGADSRLISPLVQLETTSERLYLSFWQWFSMYGGDLAQVEIRVQDGDWQTISQNFSQGSGAWTRRLIEVTDWVGETVQFAFHLDDDGANSGYPNYTPLISTGWYIDQVSLTTDTTDPVIPTGFEAGIEDWFASAGTWEIGIPTGGPGAAFEGDFCAGTILAGNYPIHSDSRLISPPMVVPASRAYNEMYLSFWHWYSVYGGDRAVLEILPEEGEWIELTENFDQNGGTWTRVFVDLSEYQGQVVRFGFHLDDDSQTSGYPNYTHLVSSGWYIDDLSFVEQPTDTWLPEDFSGGLGDWSVTNGTWQVGVPTSGPGAAYSDSVCAATMLGGNYPIHADSRLLSPYTNLPSAPVGNKLIFSFRHWFSVYNGNDVAQVQIRVGEGDWETISQNFFHSSSVWSKHQIDITPYAGQHVQFAFYLDDDGATSGYPNHTPLVSSGWYIDDISVDIVADEDWTNIGFEGDTPWWSVSSGTWEIGSPDSGPGAAYAGSNCASTVLSGNYPIHTDSRLLSTFTTIPESTEGNRVLLSFWHWFSVYNGNDIAQVEIRTEGGEWEIISDNFFHSSAVWTKHIIDLSGYSGQRVQLAFHIDDDGATSGYPNHTHLVSSGWYIDEIAIDVVPIATWTEEYFEDNTTWWWATRGTWQIGDPSSGPDRAHGESFCAGTVLGGDYPIHCDTRLVSPAVRLPASPQDGQLWLGLWQWFQIYNANDLAQVEIRRLGEDWQALGTSYYYNSMGWSRLLLDLRDYAGDDVEFAFHIDDDSQTSGYPNYTHLVSRGWYLDDLEIIEGEFRVPAGESFETSDWAMWPEIGGWYADNGIWQFGEPTNGPEAASEGRYCAGTVLDGNYPRSGNSRLISPWLTVPETPLEGQVWLAFKHWLQVYNGGDQALVEFRTYGGDWETMLDVPTTNTDWSQALIDLSPYLGQEIQLAFHFIDDGANSGYPNYSPYVSSGWYIDQVSLVEGPLIFNNPETFEHGTRGWYADAGEWQIGTPTAGPEGAFAGENCAGTNLDGNYGRYTNSRLTTSPIMLPASSQLRWWQWLALSTGDTAFVEISVDNGPWETLNSFTGSGDWSPGVLPINPIYANQNVRFGFRLQDNGDGSRSQGWYLDDLMLMGAPTGTPESPVFLRVDYTADPPVLTWENPTGDFEWISIYSSILPEYQPEIGHRLAMVNGATTFGDADHPGWRRNYMLSAVDAYLHESEAVGVIEVTSVDDPNTPLLINKLGDNYPNPFNPQTTIRYSLAKAGPVNLAVYDLRGRRVVDLVNQHQEAGTYEVLFDARPLASGLYFYRLKTGEFEQTKKMTIVK